MLEFVLTMKLAVIGTIGLFVIAVLMVLWHFLGPGRVTVVGPKGGPVLVALDERAAVEVAPREVKHFTVGRGSHVVRVGDESYTVQANGGTFDVVAPAKNQCFATFDVTVGMYQKVNVAEAIQPPVVLLESHPAGTPFDAQGVYFRMSEMPPRIPLDQRMDLLREVPCEYLGHTRALVELALVRDES